MVTSARKRGATPVAPTTLRDRLAALVPVLRERSASAERDRRIPDASIDAFRAAGLFRALIPRAQGGDDLDAAEVLDAATEIGRGCAASGWVGCLLALHNAVIRFVDEPTRDELCADGPDLCLASSFAPQADAEGKKNEFRVSGRWAFSSGIDHCTWVLLLLPIESHPGNVLLFLVPKSDYRIVDDWHVAGLRGTGSKSVILENARIPHHRTLVWQQGSGKPPTQLAHARGAKTKSVEAPGRWTFEVSFGSPFAPAAIGASMGMLEAFREQLVTRLDGDGKRATSGPMIRLAQAAARIDSVRTLYRRDLRELRRGNLSDSSAARIFFDNAFIVDTCVQAVDLLFETSGGRALYDTSPLQRFFRDIHAMRQHATLDVDLHGEAYGRHLVKPHFEVGARIDVDRT